MIDILKVAEAVVAAEAGDIATNVAGQLVKAWADRWADEDAAAWKILAVEQPWHLWLDPHTLLVGCMDLIAKDGTGVLGCEWKTRRAPRITKAGAYYKGDTPEDWLQEIRGGVQVGCYGLHLYATYCLDYCLEEELPRILVRAIIKSDSPEFWPPEPGAGLITFTPERLDATQRALQARAAMIRGARAAGHLPWQWVGRQCKAGTDYQCPVYPACSEMEWPDGGRSIVIHNGAPIAEMPHKPGCIVEVVNINDIRVHHVPAQLFSPTDPGAAAIAASGANLADPQLVILSASAYETGSQCLEKYRQSAAGLLTEESEALATGKAVHAGLAELYRQIQEAQRVESV